jgi:hypothetical protein
MDGLELMAIGRTRCVELAYEGGVWVDLRGRPVEGLADVTCFSCMSSTFTFEDEPIPFCPACGNIEREAFGTFEALLERLQGQSWAFLGRIGRAAFGVHRPHGWELAFARDADELLRTSRYGDVRRIHPRS